MGVFRDMIVDYQKRQEMRKHPVFQNIMSRLYYNTEQIGNTRYLLRQAHENTTRNNKNGVVKLPEWVQYYFASGQKRQTVDDTFQSRQYYGRTEKELAMLSNTLFNTLKADGFNITPQAVANIIYVYIIDLPYEDYMRCCNVMFQLRRRNPNMQFSLSTPLDMENYDVDIMASKIKAVKGITVLPADRYGKPIENSYMQKHEIFNMIWECGVVFMYAEVNGKVSGDFPSFEDC